MGSNRGKIGTAVVKVLVVLEKGKRGRKQGGVKAVCRVQAACWLSCVPARGGAGEVVLELLERHPNGVRTGKLLEQRALFAGRAVLRTSLDSLRPSTIEQIAHTHTHVHTYRSPDTQRTHALSSILLRGEHVRSSQWYTFLTVTMIP